jgi:hypothetical protein
MSTSLVISGIPTQIRIGLALYLDNRTPPGQFLNSVLSNDLFGCVAFGDNEALAWLPTLVRWIDSRTPRVCHGNSQNVNAWLDDKALPGWTMSEELIDNLELPEWVTNT